MDNIKVENHVKWHFITILDVVSTYSPVVFRTNYAQFAEAVEYSEWIYAKSVDTHNRCQGYLQ